MSIPEWGVGADLPAFVRDMARFIFDPENRVAYHGYWDKNAEGTLGAYKFPCQLTTNDDHDYTYARARISITFAALVPRRLSSRKRVRILRAPRLRLRWHGGKSMMAYINALRLKGC